MRTLLIHNPAAGRGGRSRLSELQQALLQGVPELEVYQTQGPGDAVLRARRAVGEGFELVVAAGGDGSLHEVANGLVGSSVALGVLPVGTENVLARELGIPGSVSGACRHLWSRSARRVDLGRIGERHFLCFAGVGFDAYVAHRLSPGRKAALGALAYVVTSLERIGEYRRLPRRATIRVDGEEFCGDYWMILIGNLRTYGGKLQPTPRARIDDGLLDLCLFPAAGYLGLAHQVVRTRWGRHLTLPGVEYRQGQRIEIRTEPVEQVQLDGDPWEATTPLVVESVPGGLWARI